MFLFSYYTFGLYFPEVIIKSVNNFKKWLKKSEGGTYIIAKENNFFFVVKQSCQRVQGPLFYEDPLYYLIVRKGLESPF